jgi:acetyl esterase
MLDPAVQELFRRMPFLADYPMWEKTPADARQEFKAFCELADPKDVPIGRIEAVQAEGPAGPIPLRVYTPVAAGAGALPTIVYYHGGGFVLGDLDSYGSLCRMLANASLCRVVAVDYRLAPEHPFPAGVEDCFAALTWIEANAPKLGVDATRIAVAGDSAGATLAAVMCLLANGAKGNPRIGFQLLIYPATMLGGMSDGRQFGSGYFLDARTIAWFQRHYVPEDADPSDPRLSPLAADDVSGLAPAYIVTAGYDPLREEGAAYAAKLKRAGVAVTYIDYPTMIHGFISMLALIPLASEAVAAAAAAVKQGLA